MPGAPNRRTILLPKRITRAGNKGYGSRRLGTAQRPGTQNL